jgi:hypothetical protein
MKKAENKVMKHSVKMWHAFLKLEELHPSDLKEFEHHLHVLQNIVLSRPAMRKMNKK